MVAFDTYSDTSSLTLITLLGENIEIIQILTGEKYSLRAIYDDVYFDNYDTPTQVLLEKPSFLIKDSQVAEITEEYPLPRAKYNIRRIKNDQLYRIVNYERDDKSTVRYVVEPIRAS